MDYKTYQVRVYKNGTKSWYLNDKRHREDGPAIECADGTKEWYLNGNKLQESEWKIQVNKNNQTCEGKVVEIDGKRYKLIEV